MQSQESNEGAGAYLHLLEAESGSCIILVSMVATCYLWYIDIVGLSMAAAINVR